MIKYLLGRVEIKRLVLIFIIFVILLLFSIDLLLIFQFGRIKALFESPNPENLTRQKSQINLEDDIKKEEEKKYDHPVYESAIKCNRNFEQDLENNVNIWQYLPENIKTKTYQKRIVSAGEATYEIMLLKWSGDCKYLAFLIELEARGGGAYDDEDYKYRGVYVFDSENEKATVAMLIPKNLLFDKNEYGSNLWVDGNKYQFVLSESIKQGEFIKIRYRYDVKNNNLVSSVKEL